MRNVRVHIAFAKVVKAREQPVHLSKMLLSKAVYYRFGTRTP